MGRSRRFAALGGLLAPIVLAACGTATVPAGTERFDIPTWEWDGQSAMDALVTGRLAFTDDGCTLIVGEDGLGRPVLFPNAVGLRFGNDVRAVADADSGRVFAIEGDEFSYAGGWAAPGPTWTEPCGAYEPDDIAWVNDAPAGPAPTDDPTPYPSALPTTVANAEERGWYAVPTFAWDPADGGDGALLVGTVTMTADGCPVLAGPDGATGLVLPNAWGTRTGEPAQPMVYSWFPESSGLMAEEGMAVSFAGGAADVAGDPGEQWERLCPESPVDGLFLVQDTVPWE